MPSSRRSALEESEDEEQPTSARPSRKRNMAIDSDDDEGVDEPMDTAAPGQSQVVFSSQYPEMSQAINGVKSSEQMKLMDMTEEKRDRAIADLTRTVLFKALAHEAIDRVKCAKDAGVDGKLANALYEQVEIRLQNTFGYELKRIPPFMENMKGLPEKYKNRFYLVTMLADQGDHYKRKYSVHEECAKEKGLLMIVLGLAYCQGFARSDGSRWILDRDLYSFLHQLDDNIPSEPLQAGSRKKRIPTQSQSQARGGRVLQTPDVDASLDLFEKRDYILKMKAADINPKADGALDGHFYYSMGPRAMVEIGRKQVIYFCSEILDQEADPQMLKELDEFGEEEEG